MPTGIDFERIRQCLSDKDLTALFVDVLGWDAPLGSGRRVRVDDAIEAREVATKKGVGVWHCGSIPGGEGQRRLDAEIARLTAERVLVFDDGMEQQWKWPEPRKSGGGTRLVSHRYVAGSKNEGLIQRLAAVRFSLAEQATLTVVQVRERVRLAFNADTVTAKFYGEFKDHHDELVGTDEKPGQILGIPDLGDLAWYGSVLMNRLMFMYFLQKKGFMDGDSNYLRSRLRAVQALLGRDAFYGFYRTFLLPLFHEGLGSTKHDYGDEQIAAIIGDVPYVNGGLFAVHELERRYEISVPDKAFEQIFDYFDRYQWHLDDRPSSEPNEINPDVLGYIFEQYINQKQMGAYYTKEDVTGYMTSSALISCYLEKLESVDLSPWHLLPAAPSRYVWEALQHGCDTALPRDVEVASAEDDDDILLKMALPDIGLPGESWREVIARRRSTEGLLETIGSGSIASSADGVHYNLDLRAVAVDLIMSTKTSEQLNIAHNVLATLSVLDPTCGSGAFLFAALDELADCYRAIVQRSAELVEAGQAPASFAEAAAKHESQEYYVLKSAILNNLYGVDIMAEATEIARLRLFLKLVAQLERREQIEPLPDLDLNIRTGNLLVGVAHAKDADERLAVDLLGQAEVASLVAAAKAVGKTYRAFVAAQEENLDAEEIDALKRQLIGSLATVRSDVDARLYAVEKPLADFEDWRRSHAPFHWFVEFPSVMDRGGFDVIVGNPPYIQRSKIKTYRYSGYKTDRCPDIYAACVERSTQLLESKGWLSLILPISFQFSSDFEAAREVVRKRLAHRYVSAFSRNPAALFSAGLGVRSTVLIGGGDSGDATSTSRLNRWVEAYRPSLFQCLSYAYLPDSLRTFGWPRLANQRIGELLVALEANDTRLSDSAGRGPNAGNVFSDR